MCSVLEKKQAGSRPPDPGPPGTASQALGRQPTPEPWPGHPGPQPPAAGSSGPQPLQFPAAGRRSPSAGPGQP